MKAGQWVSLIVAEWRNVPPEHLISHYIIRSVGYWRIPKVTSPQQTTVSISNIPKINNHTAVTHDSKNNYINLIHSPTFFSPFLYVTIPYTSIITHIICLPSLIIHACMHQHSIIIDWHRQSRTKPFLTLIPVKKKRSSTSIYGKWDAAENSTGKGQVASAFINHCRPTPFASMPPIIAVRNKTDSGTQAVHEKWKIALLVRAQRYAK